MDRVVVDLLDLCVLCLFPFPKLLLLFAPLLLLELPLFTGSLCLQPQRFKLGSLALPDKLLGQVVHCGVHDIPLDGINGPFHNPFLSLLKFLRLDLWQVLELALLGLLRGLQLLDEAVAPLLPFEEVVLHCPPTQQALQEDQGLFLFLLVIPFQDQGWGVWPDQAWCGPIQVLDALSATQVALFGLDDGVVGKIQVLDHLPGQPLLVIGGQVVDNNLFWRLCVRLLNPLHSRCFSPLQLLDTFREAKQRRAHVVVARLHLLHQRACLHCLASRAVLGIICNDVPLVDGLGRVAVRRLKHPRGFLPLGLKLVFQ
mmetsp:Transcript_42367/g.75915  ORF Transcript_42367/g.75915 Transcript_42367/m.75915 type:complete len:313 (+) Transcript_42367:2027-2965(+)